MIGHARRGPGMGVDIQIETFILLFAQKQAQNAGSQSRGAKKHRIKTDYVSYYRKT